MGLLDGLFGDPGKHSKQQLKQVMQLLRESKDEAAVAGAQAYGAHRRFLPTLNEAFRTAGLDAAMQADRSRQSILSGSQKLLIDTRRGLANRGLLGSPVAANYRRGIEHTTSRGLADVNALLAGQIGDLGTARASAMSRFYGGGSNILAGQGATQAGLTGDIAGAVAGVQHVPKKGVGDLLGAAAPYIALAAFSDRRLKADVERVGESPSGVPIYEFRYLTGAQRYRGVMSDDVRHIEGAVSEWRGWDVVDYAKLDVVFEEAY